MNLFINIFYVLFIYIYVRVEGVTQVMHWNRDKCQQKTTFLKNLQELENKLKDLQKDLKEFNELHNHQKEERYDLWREYVQAHRDYDELKVCKHYLWVECEVH